jgi:hypothetical protein
MDALILALALSITSECPTGVDPRACSEQAACVVRTWRRRGASVGVTPIEAALVSRLEAEHVCALAGWSKAVTTSVAMSLYSVPVGPGACPPTDCSSGILSAGVAIGSCALCGGAAVAACVVVR